MLEHKETIEAIQDQINAFDHEIELEEGLQHKAKDLIKRVRYYDHSTYESGNTRIVDGMRIEKPFENISNHRRDVWVRSNDFDTKDIEFIPDEPEFSNQAMIYSKEVQNYMYDERIGVVMNQLGHQRASYGSGILKKNEDNSLEVSSLHSLVFNQHDFDSAPVIEIHEINAQQAYEKKDVWQDGEELLDRFRKSNGVIDTTRTLKIHEVHGNLPFEDEFKSKSLLFAGIEEDKPLMLFEKDEKDSPYKKIDWEEIEGRSLGRGAFETGFQAQVVRNRIRIQQDGIMRVASKLGMVTDDETFEQNMHELENGFIWNLQKGSRVTPAQFNTSQMPQLENLAEQWDKNFERLSTTYEAVTGETALSGTPFRSLALQNQEGSSLLAYRREQLGLFYEEVFNDWVMPIVKKQFSKEHLLSGHYSSSQLKIIDESFGNYHVRKRLIDDLKSGRGLASKEEYDALKAIAMKSAMSGKSRRFLDVPKGYLTAEGRVKVVTTNEQRNKQETMDKIFQIFQQASSVPQLLAMEPFKTLFGKIVDLSGAGISSTELDFTAFAQQPPQESAQTPKPQPAINEGLATQDTAVIAQ